MPIQSIKIGIDLLWLRPRKVGGTEAYIRNLLSGLQSVDEENNYYLFVAQSNEDSFDFLHSSNFHKIVCAINNHNKALRILYTNLFLPRMLKDLHLDIVLFPTYMRPLAKLKVASLSNIHDLQYLHYPKNFSFIRRLIFNIFYPISLKKSDKVIAISNFVKQDIIQHYGDKISDLASKLTVIYNPIVFNTFQNRESARIILDKWGLREKEFIYTVSSMFPHKNLITLLNAFVLLKRKFNKIKLLISGIGGPSLKDLLKLISDFRLGEDVVITGFIPDNERDIFYANCLSFTLPSIFEGFGMPAVEAMWYGTPVVVSDIPVMREITLGKAIYVSDYFNPEAWYKALSNIILGEIKYSISESDKNLLIEKYGIKNIAKIYLDIFKRLRESHQGSTWK